MLKPTLVADVRSVLRRSLPEANFSHFTELGAAPMGLGATGICLPRQPELSPLDRSREVMNSLEAATVLSRQFPGTPLVLLTMPVQVAARDREPIRSIPLEVNPGGLAVSIRTALVDEFRECVPSSAEALLAELGVIERQDRAYYASADHAHDAVAGYNYRQRRRSDILSELLELKRGVWDGG